MAMMWADGVQLHYYRRGRPQLPGVVLVHGLATNTAFWFPQVLPTLARDYQVTAYDLRGHGRSGMPASGYRTSEMVGDLHALLQHERPGAVHLVGHSYGGAVVLEYAARHPDRVASVTVADTRLGAFQPDLQPTEWLNTDAGWQRLAQVITAVGGEQAGGLPPGHAGPPSRLAQVGFSAPTVERWRNLLRTTSASLDLLTAPGPGLKELAEIRVPVLAIYGGLSDFVPSGQGLQHHVMDCRLVVIPGVGHFLPRRRPEVFIREVREFLDELTGVAECAP
jgi:pimeloyl-ACP methyl ester carboxylesterase